MPGRLAGTWSGPVQSNALSALQAHAGSFGDELRFPPASKEPAEGGTPRNMPSLDFALAGRLEELKAKGRLVVRGAHRPILVVYDRGRVFALDNRCPHMGFPLDRGSVEDGILTCHWHHARFDLESGCTSTCGRTTHPPARWRCGTARSG